MVEFSGLITALPWEAYFTLGVIVAAMIALVRELATPDLVLLGALGVLLLSGILSPEEAFAGFANPAVLAVGALFVVAAGVQQTDALGSLDRMLLPGTKRIPMVLARMMAPAALLSAFMNNTPIVAMMAPRLQEWAKRTGVPASKVLIPLSYAAIVGGMVTLIGTSTNIVVSGLLIASGYPGFSMFELAWVGLPVSIGVITYFALVGHRLLPGRRQADPLDDGLQDCLFELRVAPASPLVGRTVEEAGLRALGDAFLVHIRRGTRLIGPIGPGEVLQPNDVLTFTGNPDALGILLQRSGLSRVVPALEAEYETLPLYEAVVAPSSKLVGKTLREAHFRENYHGVVLAVQRKDERLSGPLGQTPLRAGDLLLVEARNGFDKHWNANREEFYLVAPRHRSHPVHSGRAPVALLILGAMVAVVAAGLLPIATAAFTAALAMVVTRCLHGREARQAVDLSVLVVIAAALGIGYAVEKTGLADVIAHGMVVLTADLGPVFAFIALYVTTNLLTEMITHKAAAVLMLPVALAVALELGIDPKACAVIVTIAAAGSFITPIGYQTNLMVMAAGGYRFRDYVRAGVPVALLVMFITVTVVYLVWI